MRIVMQKLRVPTEYQTMSIEEVRAQALAKGWQFVAHRLLACGGYWKDASGACFYAVEAPAKKGKRK